mgnify:CR=1 FL=1
MEVIYIYNLEQCNFYMEQGVKAIGCGINKHTKKAWIKFLKKDTIVAYEMWLGRKR